MKKFNLSLVAVLAMSTFAIAGGDIAPVEVEPVVETPVEADAGAFYLGIGYGGMEAKLDTDIFNINKSSDTFDQVLIQAGYNFNEYIAVEGRYYIGFNDNTWDRYAHPLKSKQDISADAWDIFVKPMYPVTDSLDVYALLGYGETSFDYKHGDTSMGDTGGFAWGLGAQYKFTDSIGIFVDYIDQQDNDIDVLDGLLNSNIDVDFDTWSVGITYTF